MTNREYLISVLNMTSQHKNWGSVARRFIPCPYDLGDPMAYCNDFRGLPVKDPSTENCGICKKLWLGMERTKDYGRVR